MRTVRKVSGTSWPTLTRTYYGEWSVTMKVKLRARWLWNAVNKGTDNEEDGMSALEAILAAVPAEYREPLGAKNSAKEAWEAIAAMCVDSDRAKKATAQLLKQEYATSSSRMVSRWRTSPSACSRSSAAGEPRRHHRRKRDGL